jgi:two-component system sensor histidine kinase DesK
LREVRSAVTGYRSEGIAAEVTKARKTLDSAGIRLSTDFQSVVLSTEQNDLLCFVLREAVTNILRHANATKCRIELIHDHSIGLTIEDDGIGKRGHDGNGILGMKERLRHANGSLTIEPSPLGGLRIVAHLPSFTVKNR